MHKAIETLAQITDRKKFKDMWWTIAAEKLALHKLLVG